MPLCVPSITHYKATQDTFSMTEQAVSCEPKGQAQTEPENPWLSVLLQQGH